MSGGTLANGVKNNINQTTRHRMGCNGEEIQQRSRMLCIDGAILGDKQLTATQKIVYLRICWFEVYSESAAKTAEFLGLSVRQVEEARRALEKRGYIKCVCNTGRGKQYRAKELEEGEK